MRAAVFIAVQTEVGKIDVPAALTFQILAVKIDLAVFAIISMQASGIDIAIFVAV